MNKNIIVLRNVGRRIVQSTCPTLPNNWEALDLSDVVGEDKPDGDKVDGEDEAAFKGMDRLVGVSKTLLTEFVGAACDVSVR